MAHHVFYDGQEVAPPRPALLHAGPLTLVYQAGDLRYIRLGEREVVRRIYFAARDAQWGTPPNIIERESIETGSKTFKIIYVARTRQGDVSLYWQAELKGASDGAITARVWGRAERGFMANRLGLCLLHPAADCAGARCRVTHSDDAVEEGRFPERIAPHQPFRDIRAIAHEVAPDLWATVTFSGEVFEMEDQRNWTDASWKTYSRPLALPYPFEVRQGERFNQTITLRLDGNVPASGPAVAAPSNATTVRVGQPMHGSLPAIGLGMGALPAAAAVEALGALDLGHVRVELDAAAGDDIAPGHWASATRALGLPLELALRPAPGQEDELVARATAWVQREGLPLARVLLCTTPDTDVPRLIARTRADVAKVACDVPILVGTDGYFTNLNRERPPVTGSDGVAVAGVFYSLNPQVHAFDNDSLIETLPTQAETVRSAQALYPGLAVAVTPVTLRPRKVAAVDPRQGALLGAGWTLGSIASLATAGVSSLTYYQAAGPQGIIGEAGERYPVYHVLRWLAGWRGAAICPVATSVPLRLQGLALQQGARQRLILANLGGAPLEVRITGLGAAAQAIWLDERNAENGVLGELAAPAALPTQAGGATVPLWPYGLVCIDARWE